MKKIYFLLVFCFLSCLSFGQAGFDQEGLAINGTYYSGPNRGSGSDPYFSGVNLGSFTSGNTLQITRAYEWIYTNSASGNFYDAYAGWKLYYRVYEQGSTPPAYSSEILSNLASTNTDGNNYKHSLRDNSSTINLLSLVRKGGLTQHVDIYWEFQYSINSSGTNTATSSVVSATFTADATLAVEVTDFSASAKKENVLLKWLTASENDNAYFSVEKSKNGKDFLAIGEVKATNATTGSNYNFTDVVPNVGINYYRLNAVDFSGASQYSKIISVVFGATTGKVLNLSPNPASDKISFSFGTENTSATIFDISGKVFQLLNNNAHDISVNELPTGIYFLRLTDNAGNLIGQERFVKN